MDPMEEAVPVNLVTKINLKYKNIPDHIRDVFIFQDEKSMIMWQYSFFWSIDLPPSLWLKHFANFIFFANITLLFKNKQHIPL